MALIRKVLKEKWTFVRKMNKFCMVPATHISDQKSSGDRVPTIPLLTVADRQEGRKLEPWTKEGIRNCSSEQNMN